MSQPRGIQYKQSDESITVGIPSYNRGEVLCRTLSQIMPHLSPVVREVIVADQCPAHSSEVTAHLRELEENPRLTRLVLTKSGVTYARNAILAHATGSIVVFLDDDVILPADFFENYHSAFVRTGAQVIQGQVIQLYNVADFSLSAEILCSHGMPQYGEVSKPMTDLGFIIGANHAVRREHALAIGGYDGHMSCGASKNEEADFVVRAAQAPGDVYYAAECWLIHYSAPSGGQRTPIRPIRDEWKKSYTDLLWCFRHGRRLGNPGKLFWKAIRRGPLRKDNIGRFWRQPWAWMSFVFAAVRAFRYHSEILGISSDGTPLRFHYSHRLHPCSGKPSSSC